MATASHVSIAHNTVTKIHERYAGPDQGAGSRLPVLIASTAPAPEALLDDEGQEDSADISFRIERCTEDDSDAENCAEYLPHPEMTTKECGRVTFRSRVRITSGISRHRRTTAQHNQSYSIPGLTPDSSRSSSPSSSISAPLRFHSEEPEPKPGWGTLGQRVSLLGRRNSRKRSPQTRQTMTRLGATLPGDAHVATMHSSETTPLLAASGTMYARHNACDCGRCRDEAVCSKSLTSDPIHFLNARWWWDSLHYYITCRCLDESDED
ncbi:hypothetical protein FA15DRAFT_21652 [Coprinopsis marcescibilis]|uniref:Uncharacterized protein n=1 Tax=Coprinopsis marcescibilis TaxID=230819 RepID=A0A5C3LDD8_COPMA|nr:hypothetical protein FA15DRAFT_21652 [Coprinopsis marcescibilis]